jgi:hypothetical protein
MAGLPKDCFTLSLPRGIREPEAFPATVEGYTMPHQSTTRESLDSGFCMPGLPVDKRWAGSGERGWPACTSAGSSFQ